MNKIFISLLLVAGLSGFAGQLIAASHTDSLAGVPSFGIVQETAAITANGDILVDLHNSTNYRDMIRIGAFGGEVMINLDGGKAARGLGYKASINSNMAAYGMLFLDNDASVTNLTAGISYTTRASGFILNGNAEIFSQSNTGGGGGPSETFLDVRGSGFYPLDINAASGSVLLGVEIDIQIDPTSETDIYIGLRWIPKTNIVLDLGVFESIDANNTSTVGTPAFVRVNIGF